MADLSSAETSMISAASAPLGEVGQSAHHLTGMNLLVRNALWSILGRAAPLLIALVSIPILIHGLGTAKYGVLNLGWVVVGYLNLFDFGLGRALTLVIAERLGADKEEEVPSLFWKALFLLVVLGVAGSVVGIIISRWLAYSALTIPQGMKAETLHVFYLLSLWLPIQISESGLRGLLEAYQRFKLLGTLGILMGAYSYLAPVALLPFTHRLTIIIASILLARGILWLTLLFRCLSVMPSAKRFSLKGPTPLRSLLQVGSWMTVTNILSPLMDFADRFLIGAILSVSAVTFYTAPFDLVIKMMIIPTAVSAVIFPAFAASFGTARNRAVNIFSRAVRTTYILLLPATVGIILFGNEVLRFWLGRSFSEQSTHVFQILAVGMLAKSVAQMPVALVQGGGRSDVYAQIHMAEFPVYLVLIWLLVRPYGITGAAIAWSLRAILDSSLLLAFSQRMLQRRIISGRQALALVTGTAVTLAVCSMPMQFPVKILVAMVILGGFTTVAFTQLISDEERHMLVGGLDELKGRFRRKVAVS